MSKPVLLVTPRDRLAKSARSTLLAIARSKPRDCAVVYRDADGKINTAFVFMNRLEIIGALEALKQDIWNQ